MSLFPQNILDLGPVEVSGASSSYSHIRPCHNTDTPETGTARCRGRLRKVAEVEGETVEWRSLTFDGFSHSAVGSMVKGGTPEKNNGEV